MFLAAFEPLTSAQRKQTAPPMPPTLPTTPPMPTPLTSTIRGRAYYADTGTPLRRQTLILIPIDSKDHGGVPLSGVTEFNGEFEIKGVREGKYMASANAPNVISPFSEFLNEVVANEANRTGGAERGRQILEQVSKRFDVVTVIGGVDADINVSVRRGGAISGRIIYSNGEPAIGVSVEVLQRKDDGYELDISGNLGILAFGMGRGSLQTTDDRGYFRTTGLESGDYVVRVVENIDHRASDSNKDRDRGFFSMLGMTSSSSLVKTFYGDTDEIEKAGVIKIEAGQEVTDINITISELSAYRLSGTAVNKLTRQPLKNAQVTIVSHSTDSNVNSAEFFKKFSQIKVTTDSEGKWGFKDLPRGQYSVEVKPSNDERLELIKNAVAEAVAMKNNDAMTERKKNEPKLAAAKKQFTIENADITDAVVEVSTGASLSGTITVENNQNLPELIQISLTDTTDDAQTTYNEESSLEYTQRAKNIARRSGKFEFEGIKTGTYNLSTGSAMDFEYDNEADYNRPKVSKKRFYIKSVRIGGREVDFGSIKIGEDEKIRDVQIILSTDTGTLTGTISGFANLESKPSSVMLVSADKSLWFKDIGSQKTDIKEDGTFTVQAAPGEYYVFPLRVENSFSYEPKFKKALKEKGLEAALREWMEERTKNAEKVTIEKDRTATIKLTAASNN